MIRLTLLLCLAALPSCTHQAPSHGSLISAVPLPETQDPTPGVLSRDAAVTRESLETNCSRPTTPLSTQRLRASGLTLTLLTFDSRTHSLRVLDNANGPGSGARSSKSAARSKNGIAAINGGFFTPEGNPLGLVYENGRKYGGLGTSSLGAGIYVHHNSPAILPRSAWKHQSAPPSDLLQSGPFLLKNSKTVSGLSTSRPRERSFLLWDGHTGWAIGHSSSSTLASLSKALASQPLPDFHIRTALNLDGGSSSDLWVSSKVKGGPVSTRHLWNKSVRNYLVLVPTRP